ncbi:MAG: insulinase family protein [Bacteroidales bacterium]|nr:MAG: insulinase family protein [Bacteroidales bacterium]
MIRKIAFQGIFSLLILCLFSCQQEKPAASDELSIDFEKYTLENGMDVVLHIDKSDPIVSLAIQYHVGSNREVPGRTGFAHLFEHMMFQQSENVGQDQFFRKIQNAGGTLNGGTSNDGTIYFEVVPKNALEMILWLESDRMGYMINTVTKSAFANQQNVVQNEKRQGVDNRPYGHTNYIIDKNLFPEGHPYNWQVIGEMEDLFNATVGDVKEFHRKFYVPNNATVVLAGDFEPEEAKGLIEKYFGEIPGGEKVVDMDPMPVTLNETKKLYHEDNFARAAQIRMVWPTVQQYHEDAYALNFLGEILSSGKKAPMYKVLIKEKELTSRTSAYNRALELAGKFYITVTANYGKSLADIENAVFESFERFEQEGITEKDLDRIKAGLETSFYNGISSILGKSFQLARYNEYANDPSFIIQDIENIKAVTIEDVMRVYEKYIKDKPYVATSFVPKGQLEMVAEGSVMARVVEEKITEATEVILGEVEEEEILKTPSSFDRSVEPGQGPVPELTLPEIWQDELGNGMKVYGIVHSELPLIRFNIEIKGGLLLDDMEKVGVANLVSDLMMEGTANKTPEELEEEIELLGANIYMNTGREYISISVNTLARNYDKTLALVEEILLEPRWDEEEFDLAKTRTINYLKQRKADPNYISGQVFNKLIYGEDHIFSFNTTGTEESVESITIDDLKEYYDNFFTPSLAKFHIVGNIDSEKVMASLRNLENNWESKEVTFPEYVLPPPVEESKIYFVDVPGAKQSVIRIGNIALARTDNDYYPVTVMNYKLGGSFNGIVNLILREEKGFTYGARTNFSGSLIPGTFTASSSVRSNATLESVEIFKTSMEDYREGISDDDLEFTKNALIKSNTRRFETIGSLLNMLNTMSSYDLPEDYIKKEEEIVKQMTAETHKVLAQKYINPEKMIYLVVGDAETQMESLKDIGFGDPLTVEF